MTLQSYIDEVKLKLTGNILNLEIKDEVITQIIYSSFREMQRYIDTTKYATIPFRSCIDLSKAKVNSVAGVYRVESMAALNGGAVDGGYKTADPMYLAQWQMLSGNGMVYNLDNFAYNYGAYNTALQIRNTMSTDLAYRYDRHSGMLYINTIDKPYAITIEYVPRYDTVEEIVSDYWIDVLVRLSVANAKVAIGRIRTRYKQSNAQWEQDGDTILEEGNNELTALREQLEQSSQLCYPVD